MFMFILKASLTIYMRMYRTMSSSNCIVQSPVRTLVLCNPIPTPCLHIIARKSGLFADHQQVIAYSTSTSFYITKNNN